LGGISIIVAMGNDVAKKQRGKAAERTTEEAVWYQRSAIERAYVSQFHEYMKLHTSAREGAGLGE
jgi:hypothetical protein